MYVTNQLIVFILPELFLQDNHQEHPSTPQKDNPEKMSDIDTGTFDNDLEKDDVDYLFTDSLKPLLFLLFLCVFLFDTSIQ